MQEIRTEFTCVEAEERLEKLALEYSYDVTQGLCSIFNGAANKADYSDAVYYCICIALHAMCNKDIWLRKSLTNWTEARCIDQLIERRQRRSGSCAADARAWVCRNVVKAGIERMQQELGA